MAERSGAAAVGLARLLRHGPRSSAHMVCARHTLLRALHRPHHAVVRRGQGAAGALARLACCALCGWAGEVSRQAGGGMDRAMAGWLVEPGTSGRAVACTRRQQQPAAGSSAPQPDRRTRRGTGLASLGAGAVGGAAGGALGLQKAQAGGRGWNQCGSPRRADSEAGASRGAPPQAAQGRAQSSAQLRRAQTPAPLALPCRLPAPPWRPPSPSPPRPWRRRCRRRCARLPWPGDRE